MGPAGAFRRSGKAKADFEMLIHRSHLSTWESKCKRWEPVERSSSPADEGGVIVVGFVGEAASCTQDEADFPDEVAAPGTIDPVAELLFHLIELIFPFPCVGGDLKNA